MDIDKKGAVSEVVSGSSVVDSICHSPTWHSRCGMHCPYEARYVYTQQLGQSS